MKCSSDQGPKQIENPSCQRDRQQTRCRNANVDTSANVDTNGLCMFRSDVASPWSQEGQTNFAYRDPTFRKGNQY